MPSTGVPLEVEKALSSAFIRTPDNAYGTRCSTLIVTERVSKRLVTHVFERSFSPTGGMALLGLFQPRHRAPHHALGSFGRGGTGLRDDADVSARVGLPVSGRRIGPA